MRTSGRIETEEEGIERMEWHFSHGGLSGRFPQWTAAKAAALVAAQAAAGGAISTVLDLGCGDLSVMEAWAGFPGLRYYHATDGTPGVMLGAAEKLARLHGEGKAPEYHRVELLTFGQLAAGQRPKLRQEPGLVLAFDVLYHVHDDATAHFLAGYPFTVPSAEFVALSWGTSNHENIDHFDRDYSWPPGWDLIHTAPSSPNAGTVPQRLGVWRRVTS